MTREQIAVFVAEHQYDYYGALIYDFRISIRLSPAHLLRTIYLLMFVMF